MWFDKYLKLLNLFGQIVYSVNWDFNMISMCFENFKPARTTKTGSFTCVIGLLKLSNLFEPLVDWVNKDYRVVSYEFDVFQNFRTSSSYSFETFEMHQIHAKVPYSDGLLVFNSFETIPNSTGLLLVRTDSKLSKHIEFIWNYLWIYLKLPNSAGLLASGSNRFRIHVKLPNSAGLLVVRTDLKLSKQIKFMWNCLIMVVVY